MNVEGHEHNVVYLAYMNQDKILSTGTGFLVSIEGVSHLVTAKHVVTTQGPNGELTNNFVDSNLYAFYKLKSGKLGSKKIGDLRKNYKIDWLKHTDVNVDIAIIPFDIDTSKDNLSVVPESIFLGTQRLYPTYDVFFVTYHPSLVSFDDLKPIFRKGAISRINPDKTICLDAFAFPGNSGSPVFLKYSPFRYDRAIYNLGGGD